MILFTGAVFPSCFVIGLHWTNPCSSSLVGYFVLSECNGFATSKLVEWTIKLIIFAGNMWLWYFGINVAGFFIVSIDIIAITLFNESAHILWEKLQRTTEFYKSTVIYRELQLLNIFCNIVQQSCLGLGIAAAIFIISASVALLVRIENNFLIKLTLGIAAIDSLVCLLLVVSGMTSVHKKSKKILKSVYILQKQRTIMSKSILMWSRKFWISCDCIKIKFGEMNYLEELTPLKCFDFSLNLTVQILLLSM